MVHEGEDASAALAEAGFAETITVPVVLGEQPDLPGGILGNGITPNVTAVLETHLPVRNVKNTDLGYLLYHSGRIAATPKP